MTLDLSSVRIFIRPGYTDLRKAVNGLTVLVQENMKQDPFSGSVYLFCNRGRKLLKAVWWDKTGFWLSQKRLEKATFPWPANAEETEELNREQLEMLLTGIDFWKAHKSVYYERVG
jgi:transposase